ncbi:response regulator transcription factor [Campylobacter gastrosuis]|uniref:Response regulator transcription factor n=1 Tax=Campylobacter gastrosuis TaxID=2974576 RepID=A0ABT7HLC8_9BACT|nr:response regulator transcription factor [Campylobacter gastrosuis]MDL0087804.1 response regulator transcription factor [Campylobacter gastrosuis]MDL0088015.1 response regulator transcription factor [Campylobacter gastrosuis]
MKILVIEDEIDLNNVIVKHLKKSGYSVDSAFNGDEAMDFIAVAHYDLIVLDVMMPVMDGLTFLKKIRTKKLDTAVLILTAKDEIDDIVGGLDAGADDYLVKPFDFKELLARIRVLIRRNSGNADNEISVDRLKINLLKKSVKLDEQEIELTAKEYEILEFLTLNKGRILSRDQIKEHVWDFDYTGSSNIIDVLVKNIRKKLGKNEIIQTKRGLGYVIKD